MTARLTQQYVEVGVKADSVKSRLTQLYVEVGCLYYDDSVLSAGIDELTLTEYAADVSLGILIAATCDSLTLTENQAFIQADTNIAATCDALSLSGYDANVNASINISSTCSTLTLTEQAADVNLNVAVNASYDYLSLNSFYAVITNLPHNVIATDWLKYKGECHEWIKWFVEQPNKWGYLNNPNFTDEPGDPVNYDYDVEGEPVVWKMKGRKF